jgi:hypothetical protein
MSKSAAAKARRNLALGYSLPIIGGAVALIFGLVVSDLWGPLDIWVWTIIQAILGGSFVWGTRTSTQAFNYAIDNGKKLGATKGARNLNFVLGIIWSAVVAIMAFVNLSMAVGKLSGWRSVSGTGKVGQTVPTGEYIKPLTNDILFGDFLPAFVLLLILLSGIFLLLSERNTEKFLTLAEMRAEWDKYRAESKAHKESQVSAKGFKAKSNEPATKE